MFASRCCNIKACSNEANIMQHCWANLPLLSTNVKHPKFGCHVTSLCQGLRRSAGSGGEDPENQVVANAVELLNEKLVELEQQLPRIIELKTKVINLEARLSAAQEESKLAMDKANDNEQYSRKYNLRFIGIEEKKDEKLH